MKFWGSPFELYAVHLRENNANYIASFYACTRCLYKYRIGTVMWRPVEPFSWVWDRIYRFFLCLHRYHTVYRSFLCLHQLKRAKFLPTKWELFHYISTFYNTGLLSDRKPESLCFRIGRSGWTSRRELTSLWCGSASCVPSDRPARGMGVHQSATTAPANSMHRSYTSTTCHPPIQFLVLLFHSEWDDKTQSFFRN